MIKLPAKKMIAVAEEFGESFSACIMASHLHKKELVFSKESIE
jgi:hypothetical protein